MEEKKEFLDIDGLSQFKCQLNGVDIATASGDGEVYTATIPGITELQSGFSFTMIPDTTSTVVNPKLNLNGLGEKMIRRRVSNSTITTVTAGSENWLYAKKPIRLFYDGTYWIADLDRPNANDIYGVIDIANGGTGASSAATALINLGAQAQHAAVTVQLLASEWTDNKQTVSVSDVTETNTVIVSPAPASHEDYAEANVRCTAQDSEKLTFTCDDEPTAEITVNVVILP